MPSAFETLQQAQSHASSIIRQNGDDPHAEGVTSFIADRLHIYPGPYRTAFKAFVADKQAWADKKANFKSLK